MSRDQRASLIYTKAWSVRTLCLGHGCGRTIRNLIIDISGMIRNVSGDYKVPCTGVLIEEQKEDLIRL
jgi:hypothetical protein